MLEGVLHYKTSSFTLGVGGHILAEMVVHDGDAGCSNASKSQYKPTITSIPMANIHSLATIAPGNMSLGTVVTSRYHACIIILLMQKLS